MQRPRGKKVPEVYSEAPPVNPDRIESLWQLSSALLVHVADRLFCLRPSLWMTDSLGGFSLVFFFQRLGGASSLCRSALCVIWREDKGPFCPGVGRVVCTCKDRLGFKFTVAFFSLTVRPLSVSQQAWLQVDGAADAVQSTSFVACSFQCKGHFYFKAANQSGVKLSYPCISLLAISHLLL